MARSGKDIGNLNTDIPKVGSPTCGKVNYFVSDNEAGILPHSLQIHWTAGKLRTRSDADEQNNKDVQAGV